MEKFGEVLWSSACDYIEAKRGNFVLYSNLRAGTWPADSPVREKT